ncbi:hypothetical protein DERF_007038 [Dermatophagoides farinae]|uniref:Uncharacterized protein n=1 Tax=Dermatophagoides farinae TaxID=6954 RepID=A0A922HZP7_DERFA|nr:hypothetical protein DERF_007038 [Dermatophagoides farinae]
MATSSMFDIKEEDREDNEKDEKNSQHLHQNHQHQQKQQRQQQQHKRIIKFNQKKSMSKTESIIIDYYITVIIMYCRLGFVYNVYTLELVQIAYQVFYLRMMMTHSSVFRFI